MARVVMFVLNDCRTDARVLREAATLGAAGHRVTIMARTTDPYAGRIERDARNGLEIVRVPVAAGPLRWLLLVRRPAALIRALIAAARVAVRRPSLGWLALPGVAACLLLAVPFAAFGALLLGVFLTAARFVPAVRWIRDSFDWRIRWRFGVATWAAGASMAAPAGDVFHGHDLQGLAAAVSARARGSGTVVYDSHEIYTEMGAYATMPRRARVALQARERRLAGEAAALVTVNRSIAEVLRERLGLTRIVVVHNAPSRWTPPPVPEDRIRHAAGIPAAAPVVLCHGGFQARRGLEETALAMLEPGLEAAHLVFLGYRVHVIDPILANPQFAGRVHYLPPVEPAEVVAWVAGADVDVMAILPVDENSRLSTPNKLFESLAAGVPVVSSDFPERRRIVLEDPAGPLGALCDPTDPASIAAAIRRVLDLPPEARADLRARCLRAAHERWNWETEGAKLVALYAELAG